MELCLSHGQGGLELYVFRTMQVLVAKDLDCIAIVKDASFLHRRVEGDGLPYSKFNRFSYHFPLLSALKLARLIDNSEVDIVHVHWGKDLFLASLAKRFSRRSVKLVFTRQMMITRPKKDYYHRFLYSNVDLYITITEELKRLAQSFLPMPGNKIVRLYYGVKRPAKMTLQRRKEIRAAWVNKGAEPVFIIGIVGRIEEQKGQSILIQAVRELIQRHDSLSLVIIGPAMQQSYLDSLKTMVREYKLSNVVNFLGSHSNPMEIMEAMDCLVLATRMETFGLVLAEAMRANIAVIGSNAGGVPEIIDHGETGLLFEANDVSDLTKQLQRLRGDKLFREKIALAGKEKADREFCHELHYDKLCNIFVELQKQ